MCFLPKNKKNTVTEKDIITAPFPFRVLAKSRNVARKLVINQSLKPVNPLQCGKQECPPGYTYSSDDRDFWILHFTISGKGTLVNQNGKHTVRENEMFVIRPLEKVSYTADIDDPWHYIWIGFTSDIPLPPILENSDVISAPYLKDLFTAAYYTEHFENIDTHGAYEYYLCGIIYQIFGMLIQNTKKDITVTDNYIKPAITLMELSYLDPYLNVEELATRLHISKDHFGRIFKSEIGVSPKKYLNDIRMKKAVEFLVKKDNSVTQTAKSVGFPDVFAFSRAFKHYYGCSPSEYVKKQL